MANSGLRVSGNNNTERSVIEKLLNTPFLSLPFTEKLKIIHEGQPRDTLSISTKCKTCVRHFSGKIYDCDPWICGCRVLNRLYCWPCLLFTYEKGVWNDSGYNDLNNIYRATKRHKDSVTHIQCEKELHLFGKNQRIEFSLSDQNRLSIPKHNEIVKQNRDILGNFISVCCFLGKQGLTFRGSDESELPSDKGNFVELVNEFAKKDRVFKTLLEHSTLFRGISPSIPNDLISSVGTVVVEKIKKEISEVSFVALILDESSDRSMKSQMATILRYVTNDGLIQERFLNFTDTNSDKSANAVFDHILKTLNDFGCAAKLVALTYDGASVMAEEHNDLQAKIRGQFPDAMFFNWYAHDFCLVLSQSVSVIKEIKVFFINLAGFSSFFSGSSTRTHTLDSFVKRRLPTTARVEWDFPSRVVETINENKADLERLFESVIKNEDSCWNYETVVYARGLLNVFKDCEFIFLLNLFSAIFQHSDALFRVLQDKLTDIATCNEKIEEFEKFIQELRSEFASFWKRVEEFTDEYCPPIKRERVEIPAEDQQTKYERLFNEILDVVEVNVKQRFCENCKLEFMCLLEPSQFPTVEKAFPEESLLSLWDSYGAHFDADRLKGELSVIHTDRDMRRESKMELHQYITSLQLTKIFPQTMKLYELILTIPVTSPTAGRSFSCLERIKSYLRNTQDQDRVSALALMNIESTLLDNLRSTPSFQEEVIEMFAKKYPNINFEFKN